jgi:hypothetical protein
MWHHHKRGECRPSQESVVCHLEIDNLELQVLYAEVFPSPEGYGKSDLTDRSHRLCKDYTVE